MMDNLILFQRSKLPTEAGLGAEDDAKMLEHEEEVAVS
jgi:hypothetical protein